MLFTSDLSVTTSTGLVEFKFLKCGMPTIKQPEWAYTLYKGKNGKVSSQLLTLIIIIIINTSLSHYTVILFPK